MEVLKKYIEDVNRCLEENKEVKEKMDKYGLTLDDIKLRISNEAFENIKNYYRYHIGVREKLYSEDLQDFDCYSEVKKKLKEKFKEIEEREGRYFIIDKKYIFETDTANSFRTIFHDFLRKNYKDKFFQYKKTFLLEEKKVSKNKYDIYLDAYLLKYIDDKDKFPFVDEDRILLESFDELAGLYHTFNNVVLVPYGYNVNRYRYYKDIYPLSIDNLINVGFDKALIERYCRYKGNYDLDRYRDILPKLSPQTKVKMEREDYMFFLDDAIDFIKNND